MIRRAVLTAVLVVAVLCAGIWLGGRHPDALPTPVRDALVGDQQTRVVTEAIDEVGRDYYRAIPRKELANQAIRGMVRSLKDRFSTYFDPAEYRRFQEVQDSEFSGVGVTVTQDPRGLRIAQVFDESPAKRAGLVPGDLITAVDGTPLRGRTQDQSVALIKGRNGTDVTLRIVHRGKARQVDLVRQTIEVPVVASRIVTRDGRKLAVIALSQFSSGAHAELYRAIRRVEKRGAQGIVLDLRGNGGGLVTEAQLVASAFLKDGRIVTTKGRSVPTRTLEATGDPVAGTTPLVVLVDRGTASASEIVAGALQDRKRAELVGTNTFGKGVFQQVIELSNGGALDLTAGQYFTPNGRNLGGQGVSQGSGLTPDIRAKDDPDTRKRDEALNRALAALARQVA